MNDTKVHIPQMLLVSEIMMALDKIHPGIKATVRQQNAIIAAANDIVDAFGQADTQASPNMGIEAWMETDDVGLSSKYLARITSDNKYFREAQYAWPRDPADFARCLKLIEAEPAVGKNLDKMRETSEVWDILVNNWPELEEMFKKECPDWRKNQGSAPLTYKKMKSLGC